MILFVTGTDDDLCRVSLSFLERRSFRRVEYRGEQPMAELLPALDPASHWAISGDIDVPDVLEACDRRETRLLFCGAGDGAPPHLAALDARADLRIPRDEPPAWERLARLLVAVMSELDRPDWDTYFMDIARQVARRSNCIKRRVAAVLVRDQRIIATGYNGTPRGAPNCNEGGCPRCNDLAPAGTGLDDCLCNHAEENAICQAAFHGISVRGAVLYSTFSPCLRCTKLLVNAGIAEVVYNARYDIDDRSLDLLATCGVRHRSLE